MNGRTLSTVLPDTPSKLGCFAMSTIHPSLQSSLGGKRVTENPRRAHKNLISPDNIFFNYLKKGTACLKTLPVPVLLLKPSESVTGRGAERRQGLAVRRAWGRKDIFGCEKQARAKDPLFRRELCPRFLRPQKQNKTYKQKKTMSAKTPLSSREQVGEG